MFGPSYEQPEAGRGHLEVAATAPCPDKQGSGRAVWDQEGPTRQERVVGPRCASRPEVTCGDIAGVEGWGRRTWAWRRR